MHLRRRGRAGLAGAVPFLRVSFHGARNHRPCRDGGGGGVCFSFDALPLFFRGVRRRGGGLRTGGGEKRTAFTCFAFVTPPSPRDASEGKGPQSWSQKRLDRRLEEVAQAVGGGYCRLQTPLELALGVRKTVAGRRLGSLEGGVYSNAFLPPPPPFPPAPRCTSVVSSHGRPVARRCLVLSRVSSGF